MRDRSAEARDLRRQGLTWRAIGEQLGIHGSTASRLINEVSREKNREAARDRRWRRKNNLIVRVSEPFPTDAELVYRLEEIPPDTRTITGIICGDPLPGRSALDIRGSPPWPR